MMKNKENVMILFSVTFSFLVDVVNIFGYVRKYNYVKISHSWEKCSLNCHLLVYQYFLLLL